MKKQERIAVTISCEEYLDVFKKIFDSNAYNNVVHKVYCDEVDKLFQLPSNHYIFNNNLETRKMMAKCKKLKTYQCMTIGRFVYSDGSGGLAIAYKDKVYRYWQGNTLYHWTEFNADQLGSVTFKPF